MKIKGITFGGPMVRAIRDGRKDMTRRIVKPQGAHMFPMLNQDKTPREDWFISDPVYERVGRSGYYPPYAPGDILWVKETWADVNSDYGPSLAYKADHAVIGWEDFSSTFGEDEGAGPSFDYETYKGDWCMWYSDLFNGSADHKWKSSSHMPRWAARTWLRVVSVRAERVQDITEEDARREGVWTVSEWLRDQTCKWRDSADALRGLPVTAFSQLWDSIHGPDAWDRNDWVWVIAFEPTERPEGV